MTGQVKLDLQPGILIFAADHGIVAEGVSAFPQEGTVQMALNMVDGGAGINVFGRQIGADVTVYDEGVLTDFDTDGVVNKKVRRATGNFVKERAMTIDEAKQAVLVGYEAAKRKIACGVGCLIVEEVGIGNTTPSSACFAAMTKIDPSELVGRGTGISVTQLVHKADIIRAAIGFHSADGQNGYELLSQVGGLEMGAMAGVMIDAAENRVPISLDGFICMVSTCIARLLAPGVEEYMIVGHRSMEPGHSKAIEFLGKDPLVELNLRLGEGTGAAIAYPILLAANAMIKEMATFESANVAKKTEI